MDDIAYQTHGQISQEDFSKSCGEDEGKIRQKEAMCRYEAFGIGSFFLQAWDF